MELLDVNDCEELVEKVRDLVVALEAIENLGAENPTEDFSGEMFNIAHEALVSYDNK